MCAAPCPRAALRRGAMPPAAKYSAGQFAHLPAARNGNSHNSAVLYAYSIPYFPPQHKHMMKKSNFIINIHIFA